MKHKWLKETANSFNMTVERFAETVGYSRQTLYQISSGNANASKWKVEYMVSKLKDISEKILNADTQNAQEQYAFRQKLICDLEKRLTEGVSLKYEGIRKKMARWVERIQKGVKAGAR